MEMDFVVQGMGEMKMKMKREGDAGNEREEDEEMRIGLGFGLGLGFGNSQSENMVRLRLEMEMEMGFYKTAKKRDGDGFCGAYGPFGPIESNYLFRFVLFMGFICLGYVFKYWSSLYRDH